MSLWQTVLQEATQKSKHQSGTLILAGSPASGAKTLLKAVRSGPAMIRKKFAQSHLLDEETTYQDVTSPIHYYYFNAKNIEDPHSDMISRVNIWSIDHPQLKDLLDLGIKKENLKRMVFGIVLDWAQPWKFMEELNMWVNIWHQKLGAALSGLPLDDQDEMINKVQKYIRSYKEPSDEVDQVANQEETPLAEGVLQVNLGVPIVVVCCKSDLIWNLEKNRDQTEMTLDYILKALREFCLTYGASLIYTSSHQNSNIDLFYQYIIHRIYGFSFMRKAQTLNRQQIFIPSGWDSPNLIKEMEFVKISQKPYEDVLPKPKKKAAALQEVKVVTDQEFYEQIKQKLEASQRGGGRKGKEVKHLDKPEFGGDILLSETTSPQNQQTLKNFYEDLLNKSGRSWLNNGLPIFTKEC